MTDDRELGELMYKKAISFLDKRFPQGWGGCAIMYTAEEQFLISVAFESFNAAACLCMETGAMCEAQKYNLKITHSLCVSRDNENESPQILTACGICQERLRYWGDDVKIAVSNPENKIIFKKISELNPYYWGEVFPEEDREEYKEGALLL
ncbi:MAG: cytidine deaminase [Lachnospiraceae bacterium]|nr:cytidine deaminase [Lachnospiraceae bacterium]